MNVIKLAGAFILGSQLAACATIIEGSSQSVSVTTTPDNGAECVLSSTEGTWFVTSPGSVEVSKTKNNLSVTCKKDGFHDAMMSVDPEFQATTAGNILLGGVIGVAVDAASGANYEYPAMIVVPMTPSDQPVPVVTPPAQEDAETAEELPTT